MFFALLHCKRLPFLNAIGSPKIPISFIAKDTRLPFCKSKNVEKGRSDIGIQERSNFWNIGKCNNNSLSLAIQVFSGQDDNFTSPEPDEEIGHDFAGNSNGKNSKGGGGGGGGGGSRSSGGGEMEESELNWLESWKNILAGVAYYFAQSGIMVAQK